MNLRYLGDPERGLSPKPPYTKHKVHLRTGTGTTQGPACGADLRVTNRLGVNSLSALPLTDDPTRVTCQRCRRSPVYHSLVK